MKSRLDLKINTAVFRFIGVSTFPGDTNRNEHYREFVLDAISEIIAQHYKRRLAVYAFCRKLPFREKRSFIAISLLRAYVDELTSLVLSIGHLRFRYRVNVRRLARTVDIAIGFPRHSFFTSNTTGPENMGLSAGVAASSFGEYLARVYGEANDGSLVSIDEYTRRSRKEETSGEPDSSRFERLTEFPRITAITEGKALLFLAAVPSLVIRGLRSMGYLIKNPELALLELSYFRKWTKSVKYRRLISYLVSNNKTTRTIFALPFSEVGLLKYDETRSIIRTYNYSHNLFIPPSSAHNGIDNPGDARSVRRMLSDIPIGAFRLSGQAVGFTEVFSQINKFREIVNRLFGCRLPLEHFVQSPQCPVLLGYELSEQELGCGDPGCIAVFDVPPETIESRLGRALVGDRSCDGGVVAQFLSECFDTCVSEGSRVLFKPKYSLTNYDTEYRRLLEMLCSRYAGKVTLVNPYTRLIPLLASVDGCISFPYTSTKLVAEALGKPSVYFMPETYRTSFEGDDNDLVFGRSELALFIKKVIDRRQSLQSGVALESEVVRVRHP